MVVFPALSSPTIITLCSSKKKKKGKPLTFIIAIHYNYILSTMIIS